jgi:Starch-binding associating with outer membrane
MNNIKKIASILSLFLAVISYTSCETTDLDLTKDPNSLGPENADVDFLLNGIQSSFARNIQDYGRNAMELTRITNMFGRTYDNAYSPSSQDNEWSESYQDVLKNIRLMNTKAESKGLKYHIAMGQVLEAYTIVNLVDFYGDIPYSEALGTNLSPKVDSGSQVYESAILLLDKAIANFTGSSLTTNNFNDFYYNKDWTKWIKLANTIKMKIYLQKRLVDPSAVGKFNTIVASGNYIQTIQEDFQYDYGTNVNNPDSRSELFVDNYLPTGTTEYQSNSFMDYMQSNKSISDPRMKFFFYRQKPSVTPFATGEFLKCSIEVAPPHYITGNFPYCYLSNGYWGRDHGDSVGVPPDSDKKTAYGVYPIGGKFDDNTFKKVGNVSGTGVVSGAKGNGITPILLSSTVDFWRAELALNGGIGDPKALMLAGVQKSFTKVRSFVPRDTEAIISTIPALSLDVTYLTELGTSFTAASTNGKMEILSNEFFVTLFGNGIDAYNFYRRTGFPKVIQPNLEPNPGAFVRSMYYPSNETSANSNVKQKTVVNVRVFWDNNPTSGFPVGN